MANNPRNKEFLIQNGIVSTLFLYFRSTENCRDQPNVNPKYLDILYGIEDEVLTILRFLLITLFLLHLVYLRSIRNKIYENAGEFESHFRSISLGNNFKSIAQQQIMHSGEHRAVLLKKLIEMNVRLHNNTGKRFKEKTLNTLRNTLRVSQSKQRIHGIMCHILFSNSLVILTDRLSFLTNFVYIHLKTNESLTYTHLNLSAIIWLIRIGKQEI